MKYSMLQSTFQHIKGISSKKEQELWSQGVHSLKDLENWINPQMNMFRTESADSKLNLLALSEEALQNKDVDFFADLLQRSEHYRIALTYPEDTIFLDIETTGLSRYYDYITLVGWSINAEYGVCIKGTSSDKLMQALDRAKIIVTFNGSIFDIPFLKKEFRGIKIPKTHVDLRFFGKRVGLAGGQKDIEKQLNIKRPKDLADIQGEAAPVLWYEYVYGDMDALRKLISYNHADIEGMKVIFDESVKRMIKKLNFPKNISVPHFRESKSEVKWPGNENAPNESSVITVLPYQGSTKPFININELTTTYKNSNLRVIGIDLVSSEERESGWCLLDGTHAATKRICSDDALIQESAIYKPALVSIDSPLSLPKGRIKASDDDPGRDKYGIMRICERTLKKRGINVYPALIPSMQKMTARGIALADKFRRIGIPVIESYPGAAQDIMNIPRKGAGEQFLVDGLRRFGVTGNYLSSKVSHDELDAITSAIVGLFFWSGKYEAIGIEEENHLIIPELKGLNRRFQNIKAIGIHGDVGVDMDVFRESLKNQNAMFFRFDMDVKLSGAKIQSRAIEKKIIGAHKKFVSYIHTMAENQEAKTIVIAGIKYPQDYAFMVEQFGPSYTQIIIQETDPNPPSNIPTSNTNWLDQIEAFRLNKKSFSLNQVFGYI